MSLFAYLDGILVGSVNIRLRAQGEEGIVGLPVAADGSVSMGNIVFDDSAGSLSVTGWQIAKVNEADCTSAPTLFYGCVADRTYRRGKYRQGAAREIDTSIVDSNTFLSCRIVTGGSANRPSETQAARIAWLLASDAVADPAGGPPMFADLGFVNGSTKVLDAANYRGQYPAEVLNDLCTSRQEIFFTYWDQARQRVGLFFDVPSATTFTCSLSVSNVLSDTGDIDNPATTCFPPYLDGELVVDPQDVYTTGSMVYSGGTEYAIYAPTYAFFDAPSPILTRSFRVENDKVGKRTTAHALLLLMLAADSTERETLKFTVRLPSTKVGLIQAGMRISCRFSHLPGFTSFTYTRIERLNYVPVDGDPTHYDVSVECSLHGLSTGIGSGAGSTTPFPSDQTPTTPIHYFERSVGYTTDGYGSSGGSGVTTPGPNHTTSTSDSALGTFLGGVTYTYHIDMVLDPLDLTTGHDVGLADSLGFWIPDLHISVPGPGTTVTFDGTFTPASTFTGYLTADAGAAGHTPRVATVSGYIDPSGWNTGSTPDPPRPGNPVENEVPTPAPGGGNRTFTTAFPFAATSLRVFVDDIDHSDDITSSDGALRTFTLDFDPRSYEVVRVDYIAL